MIECLYEPFRKWSKKGSVYLYSDPHFGDLDSYKSRHVFKTKIENDKVYYDTGLDIWEDEDSLKCSMHFFDEMQIKNINKRITKNDTIIFLGDIGDIECIKKIKGYKVLIMGNHDKGASNYKKKIYHDTRFIDEFSKDFIPEEHGYQVVDPTPLGNLYNKVTTNGLFDEVYTGPLMISDKILLSHEPVQPLPPYIFNIHGHDHSGSDFMKYVLKHFDSEMYEKEMLDNYIWTIKKEGLNRLNICAEWTAYNPVDLQNDLIKKGLFSKTKDIHTDYIDKRNGRN